MDEVENFRQTNVWNSLIDDLLDLDRRDTDCECSPDHDAIFADSLACDHCRKLNHEPRAGIKIAAAKHFIECEIVEDFDEFRISHRQGRYVAGEQFIVILLCLCVGSHVSVLNLEIECLRGGAGL